MARARAERLIRPPLELRLLWWLLRLAWHLCRWGLILAGILLWLITLPLRRRPVASTEPMPADAFYRSQCWRRLRVDALEENRARHGVLTCECCRTTVTAAWHVDHVRPRSTHPELALDPANLQVLCADCNLGKGPRHTTDWRDRAPA